MNKLQAMKISILLFLSFFLSFSNKAICQQEVNNKYQIDLQWNGTSKNSKFPIKLEKESKKEEVVYSIDEIDAKKEITYFEVIDPNFSFKLLDSSFYASKIIIDLQQKDDKLILLLEQGPLLESFKKLNEENNKRLVLNISNGVKIAKKSMSVSVMTIPLKIYLSNQSDSLEAGINSVSTDINIGVTVGGSQENYLFKENSSPLLINTTSVFGYLGINKLVLNNKNTDNLNIESDILSFSFGAGFQFERKKINASILIGIDLPTSTLGKNWIFRYSPWIGVGLGYSIFNKT